MQRESGPSKENRSNLLIWMGLLLDAEQISLAVSFFPGNQSEIGKLPKTIKRLKTGITFGKKTVQVADKELNCTKNIEADVRNGETYIFSQSIKSWATSKRNGLKKRTILLIIIRNSKLKMWRVSQQNIGLKKSPNVLSKLYLKVKGKNDYDKRY